MMYLLDSNICIHFMRSKETSQRIKAKILQHKADDIRLPVIVVAELLHGAYHSKRIEGNLRETTDFIADFYVVPFVILLKRICTDKYELPLSAKAKLSEIMTCL